MSEKTWKILRNIMFILVVAILSSIITLAALAFYVVKTNPYNIQACVISSFLSGESQNVNEELGAQNNTVLEEKSNYDHPLLSDTQEIMLKKAGVEVENLPTSISPEMEECFRENLGNERVEEIVNGSTPGPLDLLRAKSCL